MKEILTLIIAIVRIVVSIIFVYWMIKFAMSAVDFFNSYSAVNLTAVSAKTLQHLYLLCRF